MLARNTFCLPVVLCALATGCTTTLLGSYWMSPIAMEGASGGGMLDVKSDLGITPGAAILYEVIGEEAGQRLRLNYWQVKGSGSMASSPRGYNFDTLTVTAGDSTSSVVDVTVAELLYEPAFIRTPNFRLRGAAGLDLIQVYMRIDNTTTVESAAVAVPGPDSPSADLGIDYQPVTVAGGVVEWALKPWLKVLGRMNFFVDFSPDVSGAFYLTEFSLVIGASEGHGFAAVIGSRSFSAEYDDGTTTSQAKISGYFASLFWAF